MRKRTMPTGAPSVLEGVKQACGGSEPMAYWIIWKYAPDLLSEPCNDFAELREKHNCFDRITEEYANKYIYSDKAQAGAKYLLRRLDAKRDIDLYNRYYELAMGGDVQALKAYMDFKKNFFGKGENDEPYLKAVQRWISLCGAGLKSQMAVKKSSARNTPLIPLKLLLLQVQTFLMRL